MSDKLKLVCFTPAVLFVFALFPLPYFVYFNIRWIVTGCAVYILYFYYKKKELDPISIGFAVIVILHNPLFPLSSGNPLSPISFPQEIWFILNILTAAFFLYFYTLNKKEKFIS